MRTLWGTFVAALVAALVVGVAPAAAQDEDPKVLLYTGTTGYRHADAINLGAPVVEAALEAQGYVVDREDCDNNGGGANNCDNAAKNPRIFTPENLANYEAILFFNTSASWAGGGRPGPLWDAAQRQAIIQFVQQGGGVVANHNATDMGAGVVSWDWWDGGNESVVGSLMRGHAASSQTNVADVQVADKNHLATRELPDVYEFGDEHYNFARSVRGTHHVLTTLDERTYTPGGNAMGQDHPITWCKTLRRRQRDGRHRRRQAVRRRSHLRLRYGPLRRPPTPPTAATTRSSSSSSAASAGPRARARSPTARAPSGPPSSARSWSTTSTVRSASTPRPTARSTGRRSARTRASPPKASSRCTTRRASRGTRPPS